MKFIEELQLVCWYPTGELTEEKVISYYQALRTCHFGASANRFCDFSRITSFHLDYPRLRGLVDHRKIHLKDHTNIILVIYSTSVAGYGMARMYEALMEGWDMDIYVTDDLDEAAQVLQVDPSVLQFPEITD